MYERAKYSYAQRNTIPCHQPYCNVPVNLHVCVKYPSNTLMGSHAVTHTHNVMSFELRAVIVCGTRRPAQTNKHEPFTSERVRGSNDHTWLFRSSIDQNVHRHPCSLQQNPPEFNQREYLLQITLLSIAIWALLGFTSIENRSTLSAGSVSKVIGYLCVYKCVCVCVCVCKHSLYIKRWLCIEVRGWEAGLIKPGGVS